ncbi:MAG TPA: RidA family protein [Gemmatimonadaceae bacterium]|jgi:2-iminobutanoate/2-iminopropanoate deaminase
MQKILRPLLILAALLALLLAAPSLAAAQQRQVIVPPGTKTSPNYSPAVRFGNVLFLAGQIGNARGAADSTIQIQTQEALDGLESTLEAAGTTLANVLTCTVYLVDLKDFAGMNSVYTKVFPKDPPARSTVVVAALVSPGAKIEVQCIAGIPN